MTPSENEPATFRFVAQHLNHCVTAVPKYASTISFLQIVLNEEQFGGRIGQHVTSLELLSGHRIHLIFWVCSKRCDSLCSFGANINIQS